MNYMQLITSDIANGPGVRASLFVSGCEHKCPGCFNPESHDSCAGKKFNLGDVDPDSPIEKIHAELQKPYISGLSILGGEPLSKLNDYDNCRTVIMLCQEMCHFFPDKPIWLWTGFTLEQIKADPTQKEILKWVDVIIDGPFIESKKDLSLQFRGSSNQRILYKGKDF